MRLFLFFVVAMGAGPAMAQAQMVSFTDVTETFKWTAGDGSNITGSWAFDECEVANVSDPSADPQTLTTRIVNDPPGPMIEALVSKGNQTEQNATLTIPNILIEVKGHRTSVKIKTSDAMCGKENCHMDVHGFGNRFGTN